MYRSIISVIATFFVLSTQAASGDNCSKQTIRFLEFTKNKQADSAIACFHRMLYSCNTVKDGMFVQVLSSYKSVLNKAILAKDTTGVHQCIDSMAVVHRHRAKQHGVSAAHLDDYMSLVLRVCPSKSRLAFEAGQQYVNAVADTGSAAVLLLHFRSTLLCVKRGVMNQSVMLETFFKHRKNIDQRVAKNPKNASANESQKEINRLFEQEARVECSSLDAFVSSNYQNVSHDTVSLKILAWMLTVKCPDSEQFSVTLLQLSELVKASALFADIARNFSQQNRLDKAQEYFKKAINIEINKQHKAQYYYELALASESDYRFAYEQCKRAIQFDPHHGRAWLVMARLVAAQAQKTQGIAGKALYCLAEAQCIKAKYADAQLGSQATKQASVYSAKLPSTAELTAENLTNKQNYVLPCWPNETVVLKVKQ